MFSYFEPNIIEKFLWELIKVVFQILAEIVMMQISYLAAILKRYNIFNFFIFFFFFMYVFIYLFIYLFFFIFCRIVILYSPYIYCANFIAKFGWESEFLRLGP